MAYTTIDDPSAHFNTVLYSGTGSENAITGVGFQPDWIWLKDRTQTYSHGLFDSSRGANKKLNSNNTNAEQTPTEELKSFDSDGFTLGTANGVNQSSDNFVAWNWKANGGTTSSNSDGSITSTVQANTTAGFSIVTYTGNSTNGATVGHGLTQKPEMYWVKNREDSTKNWGVYNESIGATKWLKLNLTDASADDVIWANTAPTSSVFYLNSTLTANDNGDDIVAYCFHSIKGYSKIGKYTGNGASSDGPFVYTGFKPAFFLIKSIGAARNWHILDNKRNTVNPVNLYLNPNNTDADGTFVFGDFVSNGFKIRNNGNTFNNNGEDYIYMAFAEHPFVSSKGVPTTAR